MNLVALKAVSCREVEISKKSSAFSRRRCAKTLRCVVSKAAIWRGRSRNFVRAFIRIAHPVKRKQRNQRPCHHATPHRGGGFPTETRHRRAIHIHHGAIRLEPERTQNRGGRHLQKTVTTDATHQETDRASGNELEEGRPHTRLSFAFHASPIFTRTWRPRFPTLASTSDRNSMCGSANDGEQPAIHARKFGPARNRNYAQCQALLSPPRCPTRRCTHRAHKAAPSTGCADGSQRQAS